MGLATVENAAAAFPTPAWALGLAFGVVGYSLCGMGMNLIKLSHMPAGQGRPLARETRVGRHIAMLGTNVLWVAGYGVNLAGGLLNTVGLRFAAQTLLAPLSTMALVSNAVFATVLLGERLSFAADALPMLLIPLGNILAIASASHDDQRGLSVVEITNLFQRPLFTAYMCFVVSLAAGFMIARTHLIRRIVRTGGESYASPTLVAYSGLCHAAAAALLCVNSVFMLKASLLVLTDGFHNVLKPQFGALILLYVALALFWVYTLNRLLAKHDALFIVPVLEVLWSMGSMVSGGIFFDEFSSLGPARLGRFAAGVFVSFVGVFLLSRRAEKSRASHKLG